jgi:hypothetical protein
MGPMKSFTARGGVTDMVTGYILECEPKLGRLRSFSGPGLPDANASMPPGEVVAPSDLESLLAHCNGPVHVIVSDRLLVGYWRRLGQKEDAVFRDYRCALFTETLRCIVPLTTADQSFVQNQPGTVLTALCYEPGLTEGRVRIYSPQPRLDRDPDPRGSWEVTRNHFQPSRRLDAWYYRQEFIDLRQEVAKWETPSIKEAFDFAQERPNRLELPERPKKGALQWLSSAQIHERLHSIAPGRMGDGWGSEEPPRCDVPLKDGDYLISLAGNASVKIADYYGALGPVTRSIYLDKFWLKPPGKRLEPYRDGNVLWWLLRSKEFLDQVRMELSDRVITPVKHVFPGIVKLPPRQLVLGSLSPRLIRLAHLLCHAASSYKREDLLRVKLREIAAVLDDEDMIWPGRFACWRAIRKALDEGFDETVLVLAEQAGLADTVARALKAAGVKAKPEEIRCAESGMAPELASSVARSRCAVMVTDAQNPMSVQAEHLAYSHCLDILGPDHIFALYQSPTADRSREFPGRQLLQHVFSEASHQPQVADARAEDLTPLVEAVQSIWRSASPEERLRSAMLRLAKLGSDKDLPLPPPDKAWDGRILDFVRPHVVERAMDLWGAAVTPVVEVPSAPRPALAVRIVKEADVYRFGKFATVYPDLGRRIKEFEHYLRELKAVYEGSPGDAPDEPVSAVLLQAETGAGKDALADYFLAELFGDSIPIETGTELTSELASSQLFGHEANAFTGATRRNIGVFERARDRKVLKLNEINSYPADVQFRLLRVLETGRFQRLGSSDSEERETISTRRKGNGKKESMDLRFQGVVFALSNEDLRKMSRGGGFRLDLFMRMEYILDLPPLRERPDDVDLNCQLLLEQHARVDRRPMPQITDEARDSLRRYDWPGNARELKRLLRRAVRQNVPRIDNEFLERNFPEVVTNAGPGDCPKDLLALEEALRKHTGTGDAFRAWKKDTFGKQVKGDNLAPLVRSKADDIRRHKELLPWLNAYLGDLPSHRSK